LLLSAADEVLAVDDHAIAGIKARELRGLMNKAVAEVVTLRHKRITGEVYTAVLVAAPMPKKSSNDGDQKGSTACGRREDGPICGAIGRSGFVMPGLDWDKHKSRSCNK
jgi:hypothetical protein